jgi:hypothetical protein
LGNTPGGDAVDRDLQLPVCRNAVVQSWANDIGTRCKKSQNLLVLGVNYRTEKKLCCYMNLNKINYPLKTSFFWVVIFFKNGKKELKKPSQSPKCENK